MVLGLLVGITYMMDTKSKVKECVVEAVIKRADGTVENLGVVSYYSTNPLKMLWWRLKQLLNGKRSN